MQTNPQLRQASLASLKGHWGAAVLSAVVIVLVGMAVSGPNSIYRLSTGSPSAWLYGGSLALTFFILYPLAVGYSNAFRRFRENGDDAFVSNAFSIGFGNYFHNAAGMFFLYLLLLLWALLLIVPAFIMAMAYFCVPYLLVEEPDLSLMDTIRKSKAMMRGHKMDLFLMTLGFLGLIVLCFLTLGIAFFWLGPYMQNTYAGFYLSLKEEIAAQSC